MRDSYWIHNWNSWWWKPSWNNWRSVLEQLIANTELLQLEKRIETTAGLVKKLYASKKRQDHHDDYGYSINTRTTTKPTTDTGKDTDMLRDGTVTLLSHETTDGLLTHRDNCSIICFTIDFDSWTFSSRVHRVIGTACANSSPTTRTNSYTNRYRFITGHFLLFKAIYRRSQCNGCGG